MISKIGVEDRKYNNVRMSQPNGDSKDLNPNFRGGGLWALTLQGIQECEKNPMVNVAVIDMLSAILPRTIVESTTNFFAGFEAFRRESSGLIVNCLIPSFIALGAGIGLNKLIMPKGTSMASCWADSSLITKASELYNNSKSDDKVKDALKEILGNIEGRDGSKEVIFKKELKPEELEAYAQKLKDFTVSTEKDRKINKEIGKLAKEIAEKTHVYENIKVIGGEKSVSASTVKTLLEDSVKYFKEYQIANKKSPIEINNFAKKSKNLVRSKSLLGLAIVLPLAASMQYINRLITEKLSGVKGAPIYDDFGKTSESVVDDSARDGLLKQKLISISSMIGVSLLSMMKMPSMGMIEFKGWFPTMDQARIISTTTFASRMAVADDKNELAEATVRDIATFSGLYFLGDYAGKATATAIEKNTGIELLNKTKELPENANIFQKFGHWVKNVHIKSSEEVTSKLAKKLQKEGVAPNAEQKAQIEKELKRAVNLRSACQVANLGVSLLLLGLIVPIWTRNNTKKKHAEALKKAEQNKLGTKPHINSN